MPRKPRTLDDELIQLDDELTKIKDAIIEDILTEIQTAEERGDPLAHTHTIAAAQQAMSYLVQMYQSRTKSAVHTGTRRLFVARAKEIAQP